MQGPGSTSAWRRILLALAAMVAIQLVLSALAIAVQVYNGHAPGAAYRQTSAGYALQVARPIGDDSWRAMAYAHNLHLRDPAANFYESTREGVKFQYPPSSLLMLAAAGEIEDAQIQRGGRINTVNTWLSRLALAVFVVSVAGTILVLARRHMPGTERISALEALLICGGVAAVSVLSYPLTRGHWLGQVQVYLDAAIALALLLHLTGRPVASGVAIGLCCLVKPQYAFVLVWAATRKDWRLAGGMLSVLVVLGSVSLLQFGFQRHLDYLGLLKDIASRGEVFWMNQSFNGVLQYVTGNGDPASFDFYRYADSNGLVRLGTMLTSLAILAASLFAGRRAGATTIGLGTALVASTLASPVVWDHHYGALVGVLPLAFFAAMSGGSWRPWRLVGAAAAAALLGSVMYAPEIYFSGGTARGLLAYSMLLGGLVLFAVLIAGQNLREGGPPVRRPA